LSPSEKVEKAYNHFLAKASKKTKASQKRLEDKLKVHLKKIGDELADKVRGLEPKAEKAAKDDNKKKQILSWVDSLDWTPLIEDAQGDLTTVLQDASGKALADLKITDKDLISSNNTVAAGYAKDRAAEMVGKKWVKGKLVDNPNPQWAISSTTRDNLRSLVEKAFEKETPLSELAQQIQDSENFTPYRAKMIAFQETKTAEGRGNLLGWKSSKAVWGIWWDCSEDHDDNADCECSDNEDNSPHPLEDVPRYPAHIWCICALRPALISDMEKAARDRLAKLEAIATRLEKHEIRTVEGPETLR
jgi:hypothetical protein